MSEELVLVTGGSGYIGVECIRQLLNADYRVRTTVRSLKRESEVKDMLRVAQAKYIDRLEVVAADLTKDDGWKEAASGCKYVLHVASPFPPGPPKHEDELIVPAREGTLRVLRAARDAGVSRVVQTSSFAAVGYFAGSEDRVITEKDWSDDKDPKMAAYTKSKTIAERAAWDFIEKEGGDLELSVVNPVAVFGPVYGKDYSTSIQIIQRCLNGSLPACPQVQFGVVDNRDIADLHLRAMTNPKAKGERFIGMTGETTMTMQEISLTLKERMGQRARKAPTRNLPNIVLRAVALVDPAVALVIPELGKKMSISNEKARTMLGWSPMSPEDSIVDTAESLIKRGIVKV